MQAYTKVKPKHVMEYFWKRDDFVNTQPVRVSRKIELKCTRTGYSNRGYRDQIQRHQNATTELGAEYENWQSIPASTKISYWYPFAGIAQYQQTVKREEVRGDLHSSTITYPPNYADSPNPQALSRALSSALQEVRYAQQKVSGPTFLGEARETLRMLRRPGEGIRRLAKDFLYTLRKRKSANPKGWLKDAGSIWLEQAFGWKPLLMDAHEAAVAWNTLFDEERILPFSGFGVQTTTAQAASTFTHSFNSYCYHIFNRTNLSTRIVKIRGQVRAEAKTGGRAQLELYGFTPLEFIPTAWELLPWSFLVDYFANIGDIIQAGVTDTSGVVWCSSSDVKIIDVKINGGIDPSRMKSVMGNRPLGGSNLIYAEHSPGLVRYTRRRISRTRAFALSVPDLYFTIPGSDSQLANCAALLSQANALHPQSSHWSRRVAGGRL